MPKPSAMLERIELKYATLYRAKFMHQCDTLAQMCKDAACIAANDVLKRGRDGRRPSASSLTPSTTKC